ncbi:MAG: rhodanese-like domain-containing protein [Cyanobacteria bacterium]|nr:rhodanese-like domain-containing protein [Cyanobacteriota bacterium]MDA0865986.1 rhodanese-like domain-containing protein [Cyanobacteriota bacterium]
MPISSSLIPIPKALQAQSTTFDLKERLNWGEPALTIVDVRSRKDFNMGHITGAMPVPMEELLARAAASFERDRDLYIYGNSDQETAAAANLLREAGYENVAELMGGLGAWKAVKGPIDGTF